MRGGLGQQGGGLGRALEVGQREEHRQRIGGQAGQGGALPQGHLAQAEGQAAQERGLATARVAHQEHAAVLSHAVVGGLGGGALGGWISGSGFAARFVTPRGEQRLVHVLQRARPALVAGGPVEHHRVRPPLQGQQVVHPVEIVPTGRGRAHLALVEHPARIVAVAPERGRHRPRGHLAGGGWQERLHQPVGQAGPEGLHRAGAEVEGEQLVGEVGGHVPHQHPPDGGLALQQLAQPLHVEGLATGRAQLQVPQVGVAPHLTHQHQPAHRLARGALQRGAVHLGTQLRVGHLPRRLQPRAQGAAHMGHGGQEAGIGLRAGQTGDEGVGHARVMTPPSAPRKAGWGQRPATM